MKMTVSKDQLEKMELHTCLREGANGEIQIQKVIGGWIYWNQLERAAEDNEGIKAWACSVTGVFVPEK